MIIVLLLHGLKDIKATGLLRLRDTLQREGYTVRSVHYGWFLIRGLGPLWYLFNVPLARVLSCFVELLHATGHRVICVAHSNGATIAAKASALGAPFDLLFFVNGAVDKDCKLGNNTGYLLNCMVPTDPVLTLARVIAPISPWSDTLQGSLGKDGVPVDGDPRMWNINLTQEFGVHSHGDVFSPAVAPRFANWIVKAIKHFLPAVGTVGAK